jgi:hypothetical protein
MGHWCWPQARHSNYLSAADIEQVEWTADWCIIWTSTRPICWFGMPNTPAKVAWRFSHLTLCLPEQTPNSLSTTVAIGNVNDK